MMTQQGNLADALASVRESEVKTLLDAKLAAGVSAEEILTECNRGMVELGNRFAEGKCFLPELMFGGLIMKSVMAKLNPLLTAGPGRQAVGTVVIGSVQHDVHDIGKDIVAMMLRGTGFEVIDLGVDVPPARFVEAICKHRPQVLGLSVLLTTCFKSVAATVEAVKQSGLRDGLKIMVGGAAASQLMAESTGCDFYGKTAVDGVHFASRQVGIAS
jgi:5-methyltetrahydrofolate--homocysteine methyltransferase